MRGEAGEGRGGGGEGNRGGSQATCTRQQPPTSEELIINLLSPSLECRSNSTTFASLSPASLSRASPPSPASLRPSAPVHSHSHPSSSPRGSSPPFPFLPDSPTRLFPRIAERHRFHSFLLRPPTLRRRGRLRLRLLRSHFRCFPFAVSPSISSVLSTSKPRRYFSVYPPLARGNATRYAQCDARMPRVLKSRVSSLFFSLSVSLSFSTDCAHRAQRKGTAVSRYYFFEGCRRCVISRESRYRAMATLSHSPRGSISVAREETSRGV